MTIDAKIIRDPRIELVARRTLDGNIMILDHEDMDIVIMQQTGKCLSFPKEEMSEKVYTAQDRMFKHLVKKGIVDPTSIRGGNVYGSLEANILESHIPGVDRVQATLYTIHDYMKEEKPYFKKSEEFDFDRLDHMLRPDEEDSTELGDVPQSDKKGSFGVTRGPYGFQYNYSLIRESLEEED